MPETAVCWRALGMPESLAKSRREAFEFAQFRHQSRLEYQALDRVRAARRTMRTPELEQEAQDRRGSDAGCDAEDGQPRRDSDDSPAAVGALAHQATTPIAETPRVRRQSTGFAGVVHQATSFSRQSTGLGTPRPGLHRAASSGVPPTPVRRAQTAVSFESDHCSEVEEQKGESSSATSSFSGRDGAAKAMRKRPQFAAAATLTRLGSGLSPRSPQRTPALRKGSTLASAASALTNLDGDIENGWGMVAQNSLKPGSTKRPKSFVRVRRLLAARKEEFEGKPVAERDRLRRAFAAGIAEDAESLQTTGLYIALAELGYVGNTTDEKRILKELVQEAMFFKTVTFFNFVFQIVPKVHEAVMGLRAPKLQADFKKHDSGNQGRLHPAACLQALEEQRSAQTHIVDEETEQNFWKAFKREFPERFRATQEYEGTVDFNGFLSLAAQLNEMRAEFLHHSEHRAAQLGNVPAFLEKKHFGELARLRSIFCQQSQMDDEPLNVPGVMIALWNCGASPIVGETFEMVQGLLDRYDEETVLHFPDFLRLVDRIREEERHVRQFGIHKLLDSGRLGIVSPISLEDVPMVIMELRLCDDSFHGLKEVTKIVEDCNKQGAESFTNLEASDLIGAVVETARAQGRARETRIAKIMGLTAMQLFDLRMSFSGMTRNGLIGLAEVTRIISEMNHDVTPRKKDIECLLEEVFVGHRSRRLAEMTNSVHAAVQEIGGQLSPVMEEYISTEADGRVGQERLLRFENYLVMLDLLVSGS